MITNIFMLICLGIFVYINFIQKGDKLTCALRLGAFYPPNVRERHEYWRFITCNFIHIDFFHFIMNAYAFYELGGFFERLFGPVNYLIVIFVSMLLSALMCYSASELSNRYAYTITIGASGVVYGFFGAIVALGYLLGGAYASLLQNSLDVIIINFVYTLINPQISKTGHLGGFIGGIVSVVVMLAMHLL